MNEAGAIGRVLKEVPKNIINEIIVIDGHSIDNTAREAKAEFRVAKDKFILQKKKGFGNALLEAFKEAGGDVIIIMNADGSHNPKNIPSLLKKIKQGNTYVMASRYLKGGRSDDDTLVRSIGNRSLTFITNMLHGTNVTDSLYFFTAITRNDLKKLNLVSPGFELCIEILIKAKKAGLKFAEIPIIERPRFAGKSKVCALSAGIRMLGVILGIRLK
jgi:glycosyltransferase involved in cell wall biosynthesis